MNANCPILYAEDDENDAFLMERAFQKSKLPNPLRLVRDGREAIAYLSGAPPYSVREEHPLPCLMFLDLSMPRKSGLQVLEWIQQQPSLSYLPVIVFTSSSQLTDIDRARELGAKGFLVKPGDPDELLRIVRAVHQYWIQNDQSAHAPGGFIDLSLLSKATATPNG
jgi:CheY-like chemotaxis protein